MTSPLPPTPAPGRTPVPLSSTPLGTPVPASGSTSSATSQQQRVDNVSRGALPESPPSPPAPIKKERWSLLKAISSFFAALFTRLFGSSKQVVAQIAARPTTPPPAAATPSAVSPPTASPPAPTLPAASPPAPPARPPTLVRQPSPVTFDLSSLSRIETLTTDQIKALATQMGMQLGQLSTSINNLSFTDVDSVPKFMGFLAELKDVQDRMLKISEKLDGEKNKLLEDVAGALGKALGAADTQIEWNRTQIVSFLDGERMRIERSSTISAYEVANLHAWMETLSAFGMRLVAPPLPPRPPRAPDPNVPAGIPNDRINACYRNSSNQCLRGFAPFMAQLRQPIVLPVSGRPFTAKKLKEYTDRETIRIRLVTLIDAIEQKRGYATIERADQALRDAIYAMGKGDFNGNVNLQQDAAAYVQLILGVILEPNMRTQMTRSVVDGSNTYFSAGPVDPSALYQISMPPPTIPLRGESVPHHSIQGMIDSSFRPIDMDSTDTPYRGIYKTYTETTRMLGDPPDIMPLHFKRLQLVGVNRDELDFPANDIIDFSSGYGQPPGSVRYELQSFVRHHGIASGGHYISFAKVNGQWYEFDDDHVRPVSQADVDREKKLAYLVFFKKLPAPATPVAPATPAAAPART